MATSHSQSICHIRGVYTLVALGLLLLLGMTPSDNVAAPVPADHRFVQVIAADSPRFPPGITAGRVVVTSNNSAYRSYLTPRNDTTSPVYWLTHTGASDETPAVSRPTGLQLERKISQSADSRQVGGRMVAHRALVNSTLVISDALLEGTLLCLGLLVLVTTSGLGIWWVLRSIDACKR